MISKDKNNNEKINPGLTPKNNIKKVNKKPAIIL